jgi:hypothetical protein
MPPSRSKKTPEEVKAAAKIASKKCYEKHKAERNAKSSAYNKLRAITHPEVLARSHRKCAIKRNYGITQEEYEFMCRYQHNSCAICYVNSPGGRAKNWFVDHDHATGNIRGLLCSRCNLLLGKAEDNVVLLGNAIAYLQQFQLN